MCRVVTGTGREKLKQDGVNIADWLTALALFTGHAAKVRLCLLCVRIMHHMKQHHRRC